MYEELVKSLRQCADASCAGCKNDLVEIGCREKLQREAADAIEELTDRNVGKWIPVKDLLPEESEGLRWREELTLRFTSVWCCDVNTGTIEVRNRLQGKKTGIECLDQYMKDTKWHWSQSWWEPTHWMPIVPLPEKPKE